MVRATTYLLAAASLSLFAAGSATSQTLEGPAGVTMNVTAVSPSLENGVEVYRSAGVARPIPEIALLEAPAPLEVASGEALWLLNSEKKRLTNCLGRNTSSVGERVIVCTTGSFR